MRDPLPGNSIGNTCWRNVNQCCVEACGGAAIVGRWIWVDLGLTQQMSLEKACFIHERSYPARCADQGIILLSQPFVHKAKNVST